MSQLPKRSQEDCAVLFPKVLRNFFAHVGGERKRGDRGLSPTGDILTSYRILFCLLSEPKISEKLLELCRLKF